MVTFSELQQAAIKFLAVADELNEQVSNYLNGSNAPADVDAYYKVKEANTEFNRAYSQYWEEPLRPANLDYELAEGCL